MKGRKGNTESQSGIKKRRNAGFFFFYFVIAINRTNEYNENDLENEGIFLFKYGIKRIMENEERKKENEINE